MKKNICLICLNDFVRKEVGKLLAKGNKMHYLDIDEMIDYELVNRKQVSITCGDEFLQKLERECIERVSDYEECIYSISDELFLANNNAHLLEESVIIYLETKIHELDLKQVKKKSEKTKLLQRQEIQQNVNNYLKSSCPLVVEDADDKSIQDIVKEIKTKLKSVK